MANGSTEIFADKPFHFCTSSSFPRSVFIRMKTLMDYALEASEPVLTADSLETHALQCKEEGGAAEHFDCSGEYRAQQPDSDTQQ